MRLTLIGCGTAIPDPARRPTSLWLEAGGGAVQMRIDCGPGAVHSTPGCGLDWTAQTHQLLTHFHIDHIADIPTLLFAFRYGRKQQERGPLTILGPVGTEPRLRDLVGILDPKPPGLLEKQTFPVRFGEVTPDATVEVAPGVILKTARALHTPEALAIRVEADGRSLGFTGDTAMAEHLPGFFEGVDLLVAECSHIEPPDYGPVHLTMREVAELASQSGAKRLLTTHHYFDPQAERLADRLAELVDCEVTVGHDGLGVTL